MLCCAALSASLAAAPDCRLPHALGRLSLCARTPLNQALSLIALPGGSWMCAPIVWHPQQDQSVQVRPEAVKLDMQASQFQHSLVLSHVPVRVMLGQRAAGLRAG